MAYYHPCKNCAVDVSTCARREALKVAVKGFSVTSMKFKCSERKPRFIVGQRVQFLWTVYENTQISQDEIETEETPVKFYGTVISESKSCLRFTVRVDREQEYSGFSPSDVFKNDNLVISVRPDDMEANNQVPRSFCPDCLAYDEAEAKIRCVGWKGEYDPFLGKVDGYCPKGCLTPKF